MKIDKILEIAHAVSRKYGMVNSTTDEPLVTLTKLNDNKVEIRTELALEEGGREMSEAIQRAYPGWICEAQGGCVYVVYKPQ